MVILTLMSSLFDNPSDPAASYSTSSAVAKPQNRPFVAQIIPKSLLTYNQIRNLPTGFNRPMDVAWATEKLYIAGDDSVIVMDPDTGQAIQKLKVPQHPTSICVNDIFVAVTSRTAVFVMRLNETEFKKIAEFPSATNNLVDITANLEEIFAADSYSGTVYKLNLDGAIKGIIHPKGGNRKFNVTRTGDFDVILGARGMLWISDPGRGLVMAFNTSGVNSQSLNWGKYGNRLANFSGTYNPIHIAMLPNTNIVTAELDPPRIKVYSDTGMLQAVVASEKELSKYIRRLNLTTDAMGHIYSLDDSSKTIRIFEKIDSTVLP